MANYEGKFGTVEETNPRDQLENLFVNSITPELSDTDEVLETPILHINMDEIDKATKERAQQIVTRLSDYFFDAKYIQSHPYIPNKIAQEVDNIRRLFKMLTINEKAQDTLILSITLSASKGTLYGSLTSLQNSMLSMQSQLNSLINNLEDIFREMQEQCEQSFEEKEKEVTADGSLSSKGSREFIKIINAMLLGQATSADINKLANTIVEEAGKEETQEVSNSTYDDDYNPEEEINKIVG